MSIKAWQGCHDLIMSGVRSIFAAPGRAEHLADEGVRHHRDRDASVPLESASVSRPRLAKPVLTPWRRLFAPLPADAELLGGLREHTEPRRAACIGRVVLAGDPLPQERGEALRPPEPEPLDQVIFLGEGAGKLEDALWDAIISRCLVLCACSTRRLAIERPLARCSPDAGRFVSSPEPRFSSPSAALLLCDDRIKSGLCSVSSSRRRRCVKSQHRRVPSAYNYRRNTRGNGFAASVSVRFWSKARCVLSLCCEFPRGARVGRLSARRRAHLVCHAWSARSSETHPIMIKDT